MVQALLLFLPLSGPLSQLAAPEREGLCHHQQNGAPEARAMSPQSWGTPLGRASYPSHYWMPQVKAVSPSSDLGLPLRGHIPPSSDRDFSESLCPVSSPESWELTPSFGSLLRLSFLIYEMDSQHLSAGTFLVSVGIQPCSSKHGLRPIEISWGSLLGMQSLRPQLRLSASASELSKTPGGCQARGCLRAADGQGT